MAGPGGMGTPPTNPANIPSVGGDSPASAATRKSKRMISEAVPAVAPKKRQRITTKRGQQAAQQSEDTPAEDANGEHEGDADGDVDMGQGAEEQAGVNGTAVST